MTLELDYDAAPTLAAAGPMLRAGWRASDELRASVLARRAPGRLAVTWVGGGGLNDFGQLVADRIRASVVVDPSWVQLDRTPTLGASTSRVRGVAESLPLVDGWADFTELQGVLDHVIDPGTAVREAARVTRQGGLVMATLTNDGSWFRRLARRVGRTGFESRDTHARRFEVDDVAALLAGAGLRDVEVATCMFVRLPGRLDVVPGRAATVLTAVADRLGRRLARHRGGIMVVSGLV